MVLIERMVTFDCVWRRKERGKERVEWEAGGSDWIIVISFFYLVVIVSLDMLLM